MLKSCFDQREVGTELEGKICNTDGHLCARCNPGLLIYNQSKTMDNPTLHLRQFWKDFDHPFPLHGDDCVTLTVQDSSPVLHTVTVDSTPDPKITATAVKHDSGKTDWSLMPFEAVEEINKVLEFGARKYNEGQTTREHWNWAKGQGLGIPRVLSAIFRHLFAFSRGEKLDPETGLSHIAHAGCGIIFILYYLKYPEKYNKNKATEKNT